MSKKKQQNTTKLSTDSLLNVSKYFGAQFIFNDPKDLKVKGYFKEFIKVPDYDYHIAELLFVATDKGPLEDHFPDVDGSGHASFYFPFSELSYENCQIEATINKGINDWEKMREILQSFKMFTFDSERELKDWLFDDSTNNS